MMAAEAKTSVRSTNSPKRRFLEFNVRLAASESSRLYGYGLHWSSLGRADHDVYTKLVIPADFASAMAESKGAQLYVLSEGSTSFHSVTCVFPSVPMGMVMGQDGVT